MKIGKNIQNKKSAHFDNKIGIVGKKTHCKPLLLDDYKLELKLKCQHPQRLEIRDLRSEI